MSARCIVVSKKLVLRIEINTEARPRVNWMMQDKFNVYRNIRQFFSPAARI